MISGNKGAAIRVLTLDRLIQHLDGLQCGAKFSYDLSGNRTKIKTKLQRAAPLNWDNS